MMKTVSILMSAVTAHQSNFEFDNELSVLTSTPEDASSLLLLNEYERHQGLCFPHKGKKIFQQRRVTKVWCERTCNQHTRCKTFLFAEGTQHMYSGTCALFDEHNGHGNGNTGWACYDRLEKQQTADDDQDQDQESPAYSYTRRQGICNAPRGNILGYLSHTSKVACEGACNADESCLSYVFAEGQKHKYSGTCELYDAHNPTANGNNGWACYDKGFIQMTYGYNRGQGICNTPRGDTIGHLTHSSRAVCEEACNSDERCKSYQFAEGKKTSFYGNCELLSEHNPTADGNAGWACYDKYDKKQHPTTLAMIESFKERAMTAMASAPALDEDIFII